MHRDPRRALAPGSLVAGLILGLTFGAAPPVVAEDFDHVHLTAPDTMAAAKWYNDLFGGKLGKSGPFDAVFYGNDILKVRGGEPTSGSGATSVDHIGFSVEDVAATLEQCEAAGGDRGCRRAARGAPGLHHIHVFSGEAVATVAWYAKQFGGEVVPFKGLAPLHSILYDNGGDETWLIVNQVPGERTGTDGTVVDHIGWHTTGTIRGSSGCVRTA